MSFEKLSQKTDMWAPESSMDEVVPPTFPSRFFAHLGDPAALQRVTGVSVAAALDSVVSAGLPSRDPGVIPEVLTSTLFKVPRLSFLFVLAQTGWGLIYSGWQSRLKIHLLHRF